MNFIKIIINYILRLLGSNTTQQVVTDATEPIEEPRVEEPVIEQPKQPEPVVSIMEITEEIKNMKLNLRLGHCDKQVDLDAVRKAIQEEYHAKMIKGAAFKAGDKRFTHLRHGDSQSWVALESLNTDLPVVKTLQTFLINAGIFPADAIADGFFGYGTLAGVRLFQEYVRVYEQEEKFWPDGIVGPKTWAKMQEWQKAKKTADKWQRGKQSPEYAKAIELLNQARAHYLETEAEDFLISTINKKVRAENEKRSTKIDTLETKDWTYDMNDIHLIGIRRGEDTSGERRQNDDFFVLLISGMVFIFRGSTDPNASYDKRSKSDEAFLVEGQHKFKFGWHKHSSSSNSYQGLNPYSHGVLVFRDRDNTNLLSKEDVLKGFMNEGPNGSINIHWTGDLKGGKGAMSEGCQVLAGTHYIDHESNLQDMKPFTAFSNTTLEKENTVDKIKLSRGAYNIFTDLALLYRPKDQETGLYKDYILYTLARDDAFENQFLADLDLRERLEDTVVIMRQRGLSDDEELA